MLVACLTQEPATDRWWAPIAPQSAPATIGSKKAELPAHWHGSRLHPIYFPIPYPWPVFVSKQYEQRDFFSGRFVAGSTYPHPNLVLFGKMGLSEAVQGYRELACYRPWVSDRTEEDCDALDQVDDGRDAALITAGLEWQLDPLVTLMFEAQTQLELWGDRHELMLRIDHSF